MAPQGQHPAAAARGELLRLKGHITWLIEQVEALFPHLVEAAPEVAEDATKVADVAQAVGDLGDHTTA